MSKYYTVKTTIVFLTMLPTWVLMEASTKGGSVRILDFGYTMSIIFYCAGFVACDDFLFYAAYSATEKGSSLY